MHSTVFIVSCGSNKRESDYAIMLQLLGSLPFWRACARPNSIHGHQQPRQTVHERSAGSLFQEGSKLTSIQWFPAIPEAESPLIAVASSAVVRVYSTFLRHFGPTNASQLTGTMGIVAEYARSVRER
jgi:hypothetical protein